MPVYVDPDKKLVCTRLGKGGYQPTTLAALVDAATKGPPPAEEPEQAPPA